MFVAVMSDSHDNIGSLDKAIEIAKNRRCEILFHCGDLISPFMVPILGKFAKEINLILGNNKGDVFLLCEHLKNYPQVKLHGEEAFLEIYGYKIAMVHHPKVAYLLAKTEEFDFVFCGHTHRFEVKEFGKTLLINPGELLGKEGTPTFVILDLKTKTWEKIEIV